VSRLIEIKTFKVIAGTYIEEAIQEAQLICRKESCLVRFRFNGVDLEIDASDDVESLVAEYEHKLQEQRR